MRREWGRLDVSEDVHMYVRALLAFQSWENPGFGKNDTMVNTSLRWRYDIPNISCHTDMPWLMFVVVALMAALDKPFLTTTSLGTCTQHKPFKN